MKRSDFLKILGLSVVSPSVLVISGTGSAKELPINKFKPKRWPIYPEVISFAVKEYNHTKQTLFTYVKINRNGTDYLIPVKEWTVTDSFQYAEVRFINEVKNVQNNFIVDESNQFLFDNGFIIKYNPKIHHNKLKTNEL